MRICNMRSASYGQELPHLFTSRSKVGQEPWKIICSWCTTQEAMDERRERFKPENDRIWGSEWIECAEGCVDSTDRPAFHHKDHHA